MADREQIEVVGERIGSIGRSMDVCASGDEIKVWMVGRPVSDGRRFLERLVGAAAERGRVRPPRLDERTVIQIFGRVGSLCLAKINGWSVSDYKRCPDCESRLLLLGVFGKPSTPEEILASKAGA
jgi:hypothetical protein